MATPGSSFTPTPVGHEDNLEIMFDSRSYDNPTPLAHADASRDVLPRGGTSQAIKSESTSLSSNVWKDRRKKKKMFLVSEFNVTQRYLQNIVNDR
ncbi:hypothetical protein TNCV_2142281 [Trichonephila clavipes]|uniref:Uncharacterized protein n=1 Tax=Trichonephila clavipes TaxID=2585209 RepID=A0A8X6RUG9_TRICX|nr:hypothetical protein TNCV_2142281 [Trichonephila clavipes]